MKKKFLIAIILLLFLSTYKLQNNYELNSKLKIKNIEIENNQIIGDKEIRKNISFLYDANLIFFKTKDLEIRLREISFIESFEVKRIYPNSIKIKIYEKKPVAILQNRMEKKYFTKKGDVIDFFYLKDFDKLPLVFGNKENFKPFYYNLMVINFPIEEIKTFYFFESRRWDLITNKNQTIKLPENNYNESLKNFLKIKDKINYGKYKIFDYRIKDQLILK